MAAPLPFSLAGAQSWLRAADKAADPASRGSDNSPPVSRVLQGSMVFIMLNLP